MGLGMIGAIGGLGVGLQNESAFLAKQDEAVAEQARKKDFQGWLLQQQAQYEVQREGRAEATAIRTEGRTEERTIRTEGRTDERAEAQKDRDFTRVQTEAPTRRSISVEDSKAAARGKSDVALETLEADATVKSTLSEAGQTSADKKLKGAQADFYGQRGEALEGKDVKLSPVDKAELEGVQKRASRIEEAIIKAKADGSWAGTPEQKSLQSQLAAEQLRERTILQKYRSEPAADPLGIRKPAGGAPKAGGMIQAGDTDRKAILTQEMTQARERLNSAKTDVERTRAQNDINGLTREMQSAGIAASAAAAAPAVAPKVPAKAPAKPTTAPAATAAVGPTEALGRELDASRAEFDALTQPGKRPGLAKGREAIQKYEATVNSLREKIRAQESRYADAVGGQGASFATARP